MPIVSFIITYYNEPLPLLAECLHSVACVRDCMAERGMDRDDFEVIVVDDGSQLSPQAMLEEMDADIRYVRQPNAGLSAARNKGLMMAQGEYVQFVDADDALLPHAYSTLCPQSRASADMIMFRLTTQENCCQQDSLTGKTCTQAWQMRYDKQGEKSPQPLMSGPHYMLHHNLRASACGYLFRRSMLGSLRFAEGLLHEDELFTPLLCLNMHTVCCHDVPAYYYRQRKHTITHSSTREQVDLRMDSVEEIIRRLQLACATLLPDKRPALTRRVEQLAADYIYNVYRLHAQPAARRKRLETLRQMHLLPLPLHPYTLPHAAFCLASHLPHVLMDALLRVMISPSE